MEKASKTLSSHVEAIKELAARLENNEGPVPQIEVDMLLSALREMYDAVYRLPGTENGKLVTENGERRTWRCRNQSLLSLHLNLLLLCL